LINKNFKFTEKEIKTLRKAGVVIHNHRIIFTNRPAPHKVYMLTRSMLGILNYLSKGVVVPAIDVKKKIVTVTRQNDGQIFDWQKVLQGMMKICVSKKKPTDAVVAINYRKRWYYVSDTDTDSKQTLILLGNIAGLIATVPVGSQNPVGLTRVA
jgi:hypothetical protein